jgi:hypothetical protein
MTIALVIATVVAYWWTAHRSHAESEALAMPTDQLEIQQQSPVQSVAPQPSAFSTEGLGGTPAQLSAREQANKATAPPPPITYVGPDGKKHAFQYRKPSLDPRERNRDIRRKLLMEELTANPDAFARNYGLNTKEVRWIAEGSAEFPESLLE